MTRVVPRLQLNRLRVVRRGQAVYDHAFHEGVNIIRGENGSGKSTIADFIFYVLGGDFSEWKDAASKCDEVQAEIETPNGKLTLRRRISEKPEPLQVFFGEFHSAEQHGLDGWEVFPKKRENSRESLSQVLFRSLGIPETQSDGASNVTMHQLLRLLYADQRTPAPRLFRFEPFDTQNIRQAVGDLVCGIGGYELFEVNLALRDLNAEFDKVSRRLSSLIESLPVEEQLNRPEVIHSRVEALGRERDEIAEEIARSDDFVDEEATAEFLSGRKGALASLRKIGARQNQLDSEIRGDEIEITELTDFLSYLEGLVEKLGRAETTSQAIGGIEFTKCPACLSDLEGHSDPHTCHVCGSPTDPEEQRSRYNQIRADIEIQIRESKQLLDSRRTALKLNKKEARKTQSEYASRLSDFSSRFDLSSSPRESFLAEKNHRLGQIDREIEHLLGALELAEQIQELSAEKAALQEQLQKLKDRQTALTISAGKRRRVALTAISDEGAKILRDDFERQEEFRNAENLKVDFVDDAIFVDGKMNFAESSNVFLKNSAILAMLLAALKDEQFFHPRFVLFDNVEDKGMEPKRSHLFQKLIVEKATEVEKPFQVIFTTSMMNPKLDMDDYVIGPHYTHSKRTLEFDA